MKVVMQCLKEVSINRGNLSIQKISEIELQHTLSTMPFIFENYGIIYFLVLFFTYRHETIFCEFKRRQTTIEAIL